MKKLLFIFALLFLITPLTLADGKHVNCKCAFESGYCVEFCGGYCAKYVVIGYSCYNCCSKGTCEVRHSHHGPCKKQISTPKSYDLKSLKTLDLKSLNLRKMNINLK